MPVSGGNVSEIFVSFQGEGPHVGRRHLFVRFGGCPLRCRYCDTPESLVPVPECRVMGPEGPARHANPLSVAALEASVRGLVATAPPLDALALTGGEPLTQADFLASWLAGRRPGPRVLLETAGILPDRLERVLPWVDCVSLDFKCPSNTGERARWDEHEACLRAALAVGCEVYVKMAVDDGTDVEDVVRGARLLAALGPSVPLFLTALTDPVGGELRVGARSLDRLAGMAGRLHADVRVQVGLHKTLGIL